MHELFVPFACPSANVLYSGSHWARRSAIAEIGKRLVGEAVIKYNIPRIDFAVALLFVPVSSRIRDCTNHFYAAKILEDGLVSAGVLLDDSEEYVARVAIEQRIKTDVDWQGYYIRIDKFIGSLIDGRVNAHSLAEGKRRESTLEPEERPKPKKRTYRRRTRKTNTRPGTGNRPRRRRKPVGSKVEGHEL